MMRALLVLTLLALIVVIGLSFVGGDSGEARRGAAAPPDQPGYFLTGATITDIGADGVARVHIDAARIEQIPGDNGFRLIDLKLTYAVAPDQDWLVTADRGLVPAVSETVQLIGNVRMHGMLASAQPEAVIETQSLSVDTQASTARTDDDVTIQFGTRSLAARGLEADLKQRHVRLESRVHGLFPPPFSR
jgi:LPS export ABC transporter protein LptC